MKINQSAPRILPEPISAGAQPEAHIVKPRETLTAIAHRYGVELRDLVQANPEIKNPDRIFPGQEIRLPVQMQAAQVAAEEVEVDGAPPREAIFGRSPSLMEAGLRDFMIDSVKSRAVAAGFTEARANQLANSLQSLSRKDFQRELSLLDDVLASANATRALSTYMDLNPLRAANPDRITPSIARALVMGVGTRRTPAKEGREGILTRDTAVRAARTLAVMPESEFRRIENVLNRAGAKGVPTASAQTERALILKAVAARDEELSQPSFLDMGRMNLGMPAVATDQILSFANQIRGKDRDELIRKSSVLDLDGDNASEALQQRWSHSCAPTTAQMARAEADPIYSFRLHDETIHSTSTSGDIADAQERILENNGGVAVPRGDPGGVGMPTASAMNTLAATTTDRTYSRQTVNNTNVDRTDAMNQIDNLLKRGIDVPISIRWASGGNHAMLVSDVRRDSSGNREFLVTDPAKGRTGWISEAEIASGSTDFFGNEARLRAIFTSVPN